MKDGREIRLCNNEMPDIEPVIQALEKNGVHAQAQPSPASEGLS
jgi:hypothetical protein